MVACESVFAGVGLEPGEVGVLVGKGNIGKSTAIRHLSKEALECLPGRVLYCSPSYQHGYTTMKMKMIQMYLQMSSEEVNADLAAARLLFQEKFGAELGRLAHWWLGDFRMPLVQEGILDSIESGSESSPLEMVLIDDFSMLHEPGSGISHYENIRANFLELVKFARSTQSRFWIALCERRGCKSNDIFDSQGPELGADMMHQASLIVQLRRDDDDDAKVRQMTVNVLKDRHGRFPAKEKILTNFYRQQFVWHGGEGG